MADEAKSQQIPYVPFNTFINAIEAMEHTLPPRLDKSMWPNYSGAIQSQLWSTFKFFQLVNADGTPTNTLAQLLRDKANRKERLKALLQAFYPTLMALDLSKSTLGHFNEAMKTYGLGPETQKKASSFFLQAAKAAGIQLSTFILSNTRTPGIKRARRSNGSKAKGSTPPVQPPPKVPPFGEGVPTRSIELENGITLSLSTTADTFRMTPADRKFVNELLERLETYEADHAVEADGESGEQGED